MERTLDGQIAEIVYKGEHSHPKPQPVKRQQQNSTTSDHSAIDISGTGLRNENVSGPRMEGQDEFSLPIFGSCNQGQDGNFVSVSASANFDRPDFKRRYLITLQIIK